MVGSGAWRLGGVLLGWALLSCAYPENQGVYSTDGCPQLFRDGSYAWKFSGDALESGILSSPTYTLTGTTSVECYQASTYYCACQSGYGYNVGPEQAPVCCLDKGVTMTWRLRANGVPDHYADVATSEGVARSVKWVYDVPACPHRYIDLEALDEQDNTQISTLGTGPVGFAINGVPFLGPFTQYGRSWQTSNETVDRCQGHMRKADGAYHYHFGSPCLFSGGSAADCRNYSKADGFSSASCSPGGLPDNWAIVGYALDGFKIYASETILEDYQLDNCNGKFTLSPSTGLYTYAYYVTANTTFRDYPYTMGCLGPGTRYKNGTLINYGPIRGKIDTFCDYYVPVNYTQWLYTNSSTFMIIVWGLGLGIAAVGILAFVLNIFRGPVRRLGKNYYFSHLSSVEKEWASV
jgi:hypothetical protein